MTTKYKVGSIVDTPKGKIKILDYTPVKDYQIIDVNTPELLLDSLRVDGYVMYR